jgi:DNA-3-methyladenine glycosylase
VTAGTRAAVLPAEFFHRDTVAVARALLGAMLVTVTRNRRTAGVIVEVEAYLGANDPASHAFQFRRHAHNQSLYAPAATWYVYRSYGVHWCANLVTGPAEQGGAVLLRAVQPVEGVDLMRRRRGVRDPRLLCAGPGRLTQALGITRSLDGCSMPASRAVVIPGAPIPDAHILATPRIGITRAADWPLRFVVRGNPWTSRPPDG